MSSNPFRGRTLSDNARLPITPNAETRRRRPKPPPGPSLQATWSFNGNPGGHPTTIDGHHAQLIRFNSTHWKDDGHATQGWPFFFAVTWDPTAPTLSVELLADFGGGLIQIDVGNPTSYLGHDPFDTGHLLWQTWGGTFELWTAGLWSP